MKKYLSLIFVLLLTVNAFPFGLGFIGSGAATANYAADSGLLNGQDASYYLNSDNQNAGTLSDSRLSSNIALKNQDNPFTTGQTISGNVTANTSVITPLLAAKDSNGLSGKDDGGNLGWFVEDGGYVGIATSNPGAALHVAGGSIFQANSGTTELIVKAATSTEWFSIGTAGAGVTRIGNSGGSLQVGTNVVNQNGRAQFATSGANKGLVIYPAATTTANFLEINSATAKNGDYVVVSSNGYVGIGQPTPSYALDITGDLRYTNYADGEMYVSYNTTIATNVITANSYVVVTAGVTEGNTTNMTFTHTGSDCYLTVLKAGRYSFRCKVDMSGGNADEFHGGLSVNGANPLGKYEFARKMGAAGDVGSASFSGIVVLAANDVLRIMITNLTDTDDPTIQFMNFSINKTSP